MNTVIIKWNPAFSSYSMMHYLEDISNLNNYDESDFDWSVWDYDKIHAGDRFYWVKVGMYGQTGIVGRGTVTSEPMESEDWSGQGRKTYYVTFEAETLINPDALPILTTAELQRELPDFQWDGGHSGLVLAPEQAEKLDYIWSRFVRTNAPAFEKAATLDRGDQDLIYSKAYNERKKAEKPEPEEEEEKDSEQPPVEIEPPYKENVFHIFDIDGLDVDRIINESRKFCSDDGFSGEIVQMIFDDEPDCKRYQVHLRYASTQGLELTHFTGESQHLYIDLPWLGSIGDVKLAFVIMKAIREQYPECDIIYNDNKDVSFALNDENFDALVAMCLCNMKYLIEQSKDGHHIGVQGLFHHFMIPSQEDHPNKTIEDITTAAMNTFIGLQWNYQDVSSSGLAKITTPEGETYEARFLSNDSDTFVGPCERIVLSANENSVKIVAAKDFNEAMKGCPYYEKVDSIQFVMHKMPDDEWIALYNSIDGEEIKK